LDTSVVLLQQESYIADKLCNRVANSLRGSPAMKGLMLQLGDGINVVLRRIRSSSAWKWIFHGLAPIAALIFSLVFFDDQEGDVVTLKIKECTRPVLELSVQKGPRRPQPRFGTYQPILKDGGRRYAWYVFPFV
jgi:hypothetical protein